MPVHLLRLESAPGLVERAHHALAAERRAQLPAALLHAGRAATEAGDAATVARLAREHGAHASAALGSVLAPLPVAQPGDPR